MKEWSPAIRLGFGIALAHRILLGIWMAIVWLIIAVQMLKLPLLYQPQGDGGLPRITNIVGQLTYGLWRRWDAIHYLVLAQNGYMRENPADSVFSPLAPLAIATLKLVIPGPVDIAGLVFGTIACGLALTFLYRFCTAFTNDEQLAKRAVVLYSLFPLAYFLSAPMSDGLFVAMALATLYFALRDRWILSGVAGLLAVLSRSQGLLLVPVAFLVLLERQDRSWPLISRLIDITRKAWPLISLPVGYGAFILYRTSIGVPPLENSYRVYAYVFFVNPVEGLYLNTIWYAGHLSASLLNADFLAFIFIPALIICMALDTQYRRPSILAYVICLYLVFVSKMNWEYSTDRVIASISIGRYSLSLFPLVIFAADHLRRRPQWLWLLVCSVLLTGLLLYSASHALGIGPA